MEFIRTLAPNSTGVKASLRGVFPKTLSCAGPQLSSFLGMDAPCCAKCNVIRQHIQLLPAYCEDGVGSEPSGQHFYGPGNGTFIVGNDVFEYLQRLSDSGIIKDDVFSCSMISTCGKEASIFIPSAESSLVADNVSECIELQLKLWKEMGFSGKVTHANIGVTYNGIPIIVPNNTSKRHSKSQKDQAPEHMQVMRLLFRRRD